MKPKGKRWKFSPWGYPAFLVGILAGMLAVWVGGGPCPASTPDPWADEKRLIELEAYAWTARHLACGEMAALAKAYERAAMAIREVRDQIQIEDRLNEYEMPVAERLEQAREGRRR